MSNSNSDSRAAQFKARLILERPDLFNQDSPKPLKVGIFYDLVLAYPEIPVWTVKRTLAWLTSRRAYLATCAVPGPRYELEGVVCGEVTEVQAAYARRRFVERNSRAKDPWPKERYAL